MCNQFVLTLTSRPSGVHHAKKHGAEESKRLQRGAGWGDQAPPQKHGERTVWKRRPGTYAQNLKTEEAANEHGRTQEGRSKTSGTGSKVILETQ